jgi:uncharacterized protein YcbX
MSAPAGSPAARIAALFVYPVKGCAGVAVATARVSVRGLALDAQPPGVGDREFMLVDARGRFVSQREQPALARIRPTLARDGLVLEADGKRLVVPLVDGAWAGAQRRDVVVWNDRVEALDAGDGAAAWLTSRTGFATRLVRFDPTATRRCDPAYVGDADAHTAFADGYPILVIGAATLNELNRKLGDGVEPLPMDRFRPNVVIAGLAAGDEDHLASITAGEIVLDLVKPCTRCRVTSIDQATGHPAFDPLPILAGYRNARSGGVTFGINAIVASGSGCELAVGATARCEFRF